MKILSIIWNFSSSRVKMCKIQTVAQVTTSMCFKFRCSYMLMSSHTTRVYCTYLSMTSRSRQRVFLPSAFAHYPCVEVARKQGNNPLFQTPLAINTHPGTWQKEKSVKLNIADSGDALLITALISWTIITGSLILYKKLGFMFPTTLQEPAGSVLLLFWDAELTCHCLVSWQFI